MPEDEELKRFLVEQLDCRWIGPHLGFKRAFLKSPKLLIDKDMLCL